MGRYRKRSKPWWVVLPMWMAALVAIGWGLWQFAAFRHTLIARAQQPTTIDVPGPNDPPAGATPLATNDQAFADPAAGDVVEPSPPSHAIPERRPPADADKLIAAATAMLDAGRIVDGRTALNAVLQDLGDDPRGESLRQELSDLNGGIFLGPAILPDDSAARYVDIEHGDSFLKLGRQYKVTAAFLEAINPNLDPRNLKPTTGVKVVRGPFHIRLVKHASRLDLYARDLYVRSFDAQLEEGNFLPRGNYRMKAGAKIDLGPRQWIGFEGCEPATRDSGMGWIYGSAGMRGGGSSDRVTGVKVDDADLRQLYEVLVENHSLLHVYP